MNRLCIAAALLAVSAAGPAFAVTLEPAPVEGQEVKVSDAGATLISTREGSEAWATPAGQRADQRLVLSVGVANDGDRTAGIEGRSIEVWTAEGAKLAVYDLAAMEKEIKSKQAWAGFGAALAGGLASNTTGYGYSRGSVAAQGVALSFSNVMNASADATAAEVDGGLGANLLQPTTVAPGETGGGQVLIQKPPKGATALRVRISFAGEMHELRFDLKP
jgi:hypothetical protein